MANIGKCVGGMAKLRKLFSNVMENYRKLVMANESRPLNSAQHFLAVSITRSSHGGLVQQRKL